MSGRRYTVDFHIERSVSYNSKNTGNSNPNDSLIFLASLSLPVKTSACHPSRWTRLSALSSR